jgi:iron(III) transport system permease protein
VLFVPVYLQAAAWQAGFGVQGWYTLVSHSEAWLAGWTGAAWVHAMAAVPWVVLIVGAGLRLAEPELEEQALLDARGAQVFRHVTLKAALGAVAVAALWVAILTAGEIAVTDLFVVRTYAEEIYREMTIGPSLIESQPVYDAPLRLLPGLVLTAWLVAVGWALIAKLVPRDRPMSLRRQRVFSLGVWRVPLTVAVALALLLLVGVPLGNLCYKAGVIVTQTDAGRLRSWSLWKWVEIVASSPIRYRREFGWSLGIGTAAAFAVAVAAVPMAWIARRGGCWSQAVLLAAAVALALPGPVIGLAVIWLLNRPGLGPLVYLYDQSILAPWVALWIRGLAPAVLIMWHAFGSVPPEILDAASVDGAGPLARLFRIALPMRPAAAALAWLVALAIALGDLAASILVVPPGVSTLSIRIFGLLHYGVEDRVAGICLAQVVLFAVIATVVLRFLRRFDAKV